MATRIVTPGELPEEKMLCRISMVVYRSCKTKSKIVFNAWFDLQKFMLVEKLQL